MKLKLEFDLPEERDEAMDAVHASVWHSILLDLDERCRGKIKHGNKFKTPDGALQAVRDYIRDECADSGVNL